MDWRAVRDIFGHATGVLLDRIRVALRRKEMIGGILYVGIGIDPGSSGKRQLIAVKGHPVPMNRGRDRAATSWR